MVMEMGWRLAAVLAGLLAFGIGYNALVGWLERRGHHRGYIAFLVVGGVAATVAAAAVVIGVEAALLVLACFAASGLPMVVGSVARYARERAEDEATARWLVNGLLERDGDTEKSGRVY